MSYRFKTRYGCRKKTMSEQLEIGAGRYVHDVEFLSFNETNNKHIEKQRTLSDVNSIGTLSQKKTAMMRCQIQMVALSTQ